MILSGSNTYLSRIPSELAREEGPVGKVLLEVRGHRLHPPVHHLPLGADLLGR